MVPDPHLMESMRAVGYTLETAVADLVDNSVTAGASRVDVLFDGSGEPYVAIVDDGAGMTEAEAQNAMRLAGTSSRNKRDSNDLGRFGLGLKTASISQCRNVTLVTKNAGQIHGFRWDLDYLIASNSWSLLRLSPEECARLPEFNVLNQHDSGTLVLWRNLDQLEATHGTLDTALDQAMIRVSRHLGLVFHRFLAREHGRLFQICLNLRAIVGADPLLKNHKATQAGAIERIVIDEGVIELRPYTLPHLTKLTTQDKKKAQVDGSLRDNQGFYIYRGMRLVIWGTWFRITPKQELGKLARVQVDVPNTLDHLWSLDIKKAQAVPPPIIRARLRQVADSIIAPSRGVHTFRGRSVDKDPAAHLWKVIEDRGAFRYEVNREHPAVAAISAELTGEHLNRVDTLLSLIEGSFPVEDAYSRLGQDAVHAPRQIDDQELSALAQQFWERFKDSLPPQMFLDSMIAVEPFNKHPKARSILEEAANQA